MGDLNFVFSHHKEKKSSKNKGKLPLASGYLLNAQIATALYRFPLLVKGILAVRSTCTRHMILGVTAMGINGGTGALLKTLFLWAQITHSFVFIRTYFSPPYQ